MIHILNISVDNLTTVNGVLASLVVVLISVVAFLYKQNNSDRKDYDTRLEKKEEKINQIIEQTIDDYKKIIDDAAKDRVDTKFFLDKLTDNLEQVKQIIHKQDAR